MTVGGDSERIDAPVGGQGRRRPKAILAMWPGLAAEVITAEQRAHLGAHVELIQDEVVGAFADVPADRLAEVEVIVGHWGCPPIDADALDRMPRLGLFAYGAGSVKEGRTVSDEAFARGVVVTSAAAANAIPVAEYTLAVILLANKGAFVTHEGARGRDISHVRLPGRVGNVAKRVGIIGASRTGRRLIELLRPFELEAVVHDPYLTDEDAAALGVVSLSLAELLATSDVVTIHAPSTPQTIGLIGTAELAALRDGSIVVNTARGQLVDTEALEAELSTGRISAVLDVTWPEPLPPDSPLWQLPNAFITPHVAGAMGTELARLADSAIDEVARFVRGDPPAHPVRPEELDRLA